MQPYFFPYIGYFQLVSAVDIFVFYDDVNFINRGWVNRNNFLINGKSHLITLPCLKASQNKLINEIELMLDERTISKTLKMISFSYKKAEYFNEVFELFESILRFENKNLARYTANSVIKVSNFLELKTKFKFSSEEHSETKGLERGDRLIKITKREGFKNYINAIGGEKIYSKKDFKEHGIKLSFLATKNFKYNQQNSDFIPLLSIIDVLMYNGKEKTKSFLSLTTLL